MKHGHFIPTFKILGQLYHAVGSLPPNTHKEPTFFQTYFIGNGELERRLPVCPHTNRETLYDLHELQLT